MRNIVVIGGLNHNCRVDNIVDYKDVIKHCNIAKLDDHIRKEFLRWLKSSLLASVNRYILYGNQIEFPQDYNGLLRYLQKHLEKHSLCEFNEAEFDAAVAMLNPKDFLRQVLSNKSDSFSINSGVTLIQTPQHICGHTNALLLPFVVDKMKELENATLICHKWFLKACPDDEVTSSYYKISDHFMNYVHSKCNENKINYLEYIGNLEHFINIGM